MPPAGAIAPMHGAYIPRPPLPQWFPWAALCGALLFVIALTLTLVVVARRSRWPERK